MSKSLTSEHATSLWTDGENIHVHNKNNKRIQSFECRSRAKPCRTLTITNTVGKIIMLKHKEKDLEESDENRGAYRAI